MANRPSSIDQLPDEIKSEIGRLRTQGCTIDQILEHLRLLVGGKPTVSRSALGRHVQGLDRVAEQIRRSRDIATALVQELGETPESETARLNIELMHTAILDLRLKAGAGEGVDADGKAALDGNPMGIMMLSKAIDHLASAQKRNADFQKMVELRVAEKTKAAVAAAVAKVTKARGITEETSEAIKAVIFGVELETPHA
jgi:hypothetical protein